MAEKTVRSVARAFEILSHFAKARRPLAMRDLAREFDWPSSSLADILKTLCAVGCLSFDPDSKTYIPTTRLSTLGDWVSGALLRRRDALAELERLRTRFGEKILLGARNDLHIQYLYVLDGGAQRERRKQQRPLLLSGVGWMLLSATRKDRVERLWRRSVAHRLIDKAALPLDMLIERIEACRRNGYVCAPDSLDPGASVIATLLPDSTHDRPLALGIGGPTERIVGNQKKILEILRNEVILDGIGLSGAAGKLSR